MIVISVILCVLIVISAIYSLKVNSFEMSFKEAWTAVFNRIMGIEPSTYHESMIDYVAIDVNAPRTIAAVLVGATLAICGAVMQTLTRNPLTNYFVVKMHQN